MSTDPGAPGSGAVAPPDQRPEVLLTRRAQRARSADHARGAVSALRSRRPRPAAPARTRDDVPTGRVTDNGAPGASAPGAPSAPAVRTAQAAARTAVGMVAVVAIGVSLAVGNDPAAQRWTGWAAAGLALLAGYRWAGGQGLGAALRTIGRGWATPYVGWLALLGLPVLAWESAAGGRPATERARSLLWGGLALEPPLTGLGVLGGLVVALVLGRCVVAWLGVEPVWLLPAAAALTYGGPLFVRAPLALGLGATLLSWVFLGRLARQLRPRLGWAAGLTLAMLGGAATVWFAGPVDIPAGKGGLPVLGPLASGALLTGVLVLAEQTAAALLAGRAGGPRRPAELVRRVAAADRLVLVALATIGIGPAVVRAVLPHAAPVGLLAASLGGAALAATLVGLLPRAGWLTGRGPARRNGGRHVRRRSDPNVPISGTGRAPTSRW